MKRVILIGSVLAALAPSALLAEMRYSNFEVSFIDVELDNSSIDGDGFAFAGSYEMNDRLFLLGEWQDQSYDFDIDGTSLEFGVGMRHELNPSLDFVGTLSYVDVELEFGNFSADDDGLALGGGIRSRLGDSFEIDAGLKYIDFDQSGSDTGIELMGRWYFTKAMALSFGTDMADNTDTLRVGFRAEF